MNGSKLADFLPSGLHGAAVDIYVSTMTFCKVLPVPAQPSPNGAVEDQLFRRLLHLPPEEQLRLYLSWLEDPNMRFAGLACLRRHESQAPAALADTVVSLLGDEDVSIRHAAALASGRLGEAIMRSDSALSALKDLLVRSRAGVRAAAAYACAAIGHRAAVLAEPVAALLLIGNDDPPGLPLQVGLGGRRVPPQLRIPMCAALTALGRMGAATFSANMAHSLTHKNWEVRLCAAEALGMFGKASSGRLSALMGLLDDQAFPVRAMACVALGEIRSEEALPRLAQATEDPLATVRLSAIQAIGKAGAPAEEYSHEAFKLLNDAAGSVRAAAVRMLGGLSISGQHYAGVVATMLLDEEAEVRSEALEALSRMGAAGAAFAEEASTCLNDPSSVVRQTATRALERMGFSRSRTLEDFPRTKGIAMRVEAFSGVGAYHGAIQLKKRELQESGKWIEGIF